MRDVLQALVTSLEAGKECLVCQVVETRGSTPQKAGALMVVAPDGTQEGTLGGGCVENEVRLKALRLLGTGESAVHSFLLDHDYAWADGLICGGKMVMVASSARGESAAAYFRRQLALLDSGRGYSEVVATAADGAGARALFDPLGEPSAAWPAPEPAERARSIVAPLEGRPRPSARDGLAWIPHPPRVRLAIVGAGHVGQAVAELARACDFDIWIVDDREQYANPARFPEAKRLLVGPFEETLPRLAGELDPHSYALIVTRGHGHDQEALAHLAPSKAAYVGLIGSNRKIRMIFEELRQSGLAEADLARVVAPVGIDIGSQTVPEIAVSIVAQLVARRNLGKP